MDLRSEYRDTIRTVGEEVLYQQITRCCGGCAGFYHGWAHLLASRSIILRNPSWYFALTLDEFERHRVACQGRMDERVKVQEVLDTLDRSWRLDWRNPLSRDSARATQRFEELKKLAREEPNSDNWIR